MRIFIAGIMQGSRLDNGVDDQDYRQRIASAIRARMPEAEIVDPWTLYPASPSYNDELGKRVLVELGKMAGTVDVLVAYVPQASMGTAIEMWEAFNAGVCVLTISPLSTNWVVKFLSNRVFATLDEFMEFVSSGEFERTVASRMAA
jgi:hypothetical protein